MEHESCPEIHFKRLTFYLFFPLPPQLVHSTRVYSSAPCIDPLSHWVACSLHYARSVVALAYSSSHGHSFVGRVEKQKPKGCLDAGGAGNVQAAECL